MPEDWQEIVKRKRAAEAAKIPKEWLLAPEFLENVSDTSTLNVMDIPAKCGILTSKELEITENYDATDLLALLAEGKLSSVEVTTAFMKRAAIAQQLTHCLTETFFDQALETAKKADEYLAKTGKVIGPFHGLPISVKDMLNVKGVQSTLGYVAWANKPVLDYNSVTVDLLLKGGAVLYVKTNIPQTLLIPESDNNLFGKVRNPINLSVTAGGSSGGEGALIKMRGSLLGVGTDIGGSIRYPALANGTFGFRPTTCIISTAKQTGSSRPGAPGVKAVAGPLATTARDLTLFMKGYNSLKPWELDPTVLPVPYQPPELNKSLSFAVVVEEACSPVQAPIKRAIRESAKKLEMAGHKVTFLSGLPDFETLYPLAYNLIFLDEKGTLFEHVFESGEPLIPAVDKIAKKVTTDGLDNLRAIFENTVTADKLKAKYNELFYKQGYDALILPGAPFTARPHNSYPQTEYTIAFNLLDLPAGIIPVGKADKTIDTEGDGTMVGSFEYDAATVDGLPTAIQVVGAHFQDQKLLSVLEEVAKIVADKV